MPQSISSLSFGSVTRDLKSLLQTPDLKSLIQTPTRQNFAAVAVSLPTKIQSGGRHRREAVILLGALSVFCGGIVAFIHYAARRAYLQLVPVVQRSGPLRRPDQIQDSGDTSPVVSAPPLSQFITQLLPVELGAPVEILLRFVGVGDDFEDRFGLLPALADTLSALAKETVNDASKRAQLVAGLRELLAQERESVFQPPPSLQLPMMAIEKLCAFLEGGSMIGLDGVVRGDVRTFSKVKVEMVVEREIPMSTSFRSALFRAVITSLDLDGCRLSDLVIPGDAWHRVTSGEQPRRGRYALDGFTVIVTIPCPDASLADAMRAKLQSLFSTAAATNMLLRAHLAQQSGSPPFTVVTTPKVHIVDEVGKVPTPTEKLEAAGSAKLHNTPRTLLREQCFNIGLRFGEHAKRTHLLIYLHVSAVIRSLVSLHGLRLEDVELKEVPLQLAWKPAPPTERSAGRVGQLEVDVTLVFARATVRLELSSLGTVTLDRKRLGKISLAFTGGSVRLKILLQLEGGERMCEPGYESSLPPHVVDSGAGIYLTIAQITPQFNSARLTPESREGWARVYKLLGVVDSLVGPARAVFDLFSSLSGGGSSKKSGSDHHAEAREVAPLASSDVLDLLLKMMVITPTEKVIGIPLLSTAKMDAKLLTFLDVAFKRQRARTLAMGVERAVAAEAAKEAAAKRAAKIAEEKRVAAERAAADKAVEELRKAREPGFFLGSPPSASAIESAIAACRQHDGIDESLLQEAEEESLVLFGREVAKKAVAAGTKAAERLARDQANAERLAVQASVLAAREQAAKQAAAEKAAARKKAAAEKAEAAELAQKKAAKLNERAAKEGALAKLRQAQNPPFFLFTKPSPDAIEAAIFVCREKGVEEQLLVEAGLQADGLLGSEIARKAMADACARVA